jgi:hypothetical protein
MSGDVERDIWVWDVRRTLEYSRRTFGPDIDSWPVWLSDERLVFGSLRGTGLANIYELAAGGKGEPEPLTEGVAGFVPLAAVPDGSAVLLAQPPSPAANDGWNLRLLPLTPRAAGRPPLHDLKGLNTSDHERHGTISPDGRWIAYDSNNVGGRFEVFVRPFPDVHAGRWQISSAGGQKPAWSRTSTELFFLGPDRTMYAASIGGAAKDWTTVTRRALFTGDYVVNGVGNIVRHYDVSRDGRFLMLKEAAASPYVINQIVVVQNWWQEVARVLRE